MTYASPERRREHNRRYYHKTKAKHAGLRATCRQRFRANARAWLNEKKSSPCMDCGGSFPPCAMQFDHRPGTVKVREVGAMLGHASRAAVEAEILKCDLVCANCHAVRTQSRVAGVTVSTPGSYPEGLR